MLRFLFAIALLAQITQAADSDTSAKAVERLAQWLTKAHDQRGEPGDFASVPLTRPDALRAQTLLWEDHIARIRTDRTDEMAQKIIRANGLEMRFETVVFGRGEDAPKGGRSLFISMHGGGNAPPSLNDGQWKNQIALSRAYQPAEGLYIAPRAPTNTWNLWHEAHIDVLFARLIENLIVFENVNPDRVYILGYSAGGDGVYQLAPRMADRFAAAAMMAGHPNETKPDGLRNLPFAIQAGEKDSAFKRNEVAARFGKQLDDLRAGDPGGYEHFTEIHKGKPHWMDTVDRKAVPWMEKFTRDPIPKRIVWRQDDVIHTRFHWLAVEKAGSKAGQKITATRDAQEFVLASQDVPKVSILLNDAMLDLDQPVVIRSGGKVLREGIAPRTIRTMLRTLAERGDPRLIFSAQMDVEGVAP